MSEKMGIDSSHVAEGTIHAWLDGALSAHESSAVQLHVAACDACSATVAEARGFIAASTQILSALDDVPGDVIPRANNAPRVLEMDTKRRRSRLVSNVRMYAPIAAIAVFAVATTLIIRHQPQAATGAALHQPGNSAGVRASEAVPSAIAGRVAEAPRPVPVAPRVGAADATAPMMAAEKSRAAVAPQSQVSQLVTAASTVGSARVGDSLTITGRVTAEATGLPLASATVSVVGTSSNTVTDSNGDFKIGNVPRGAQTLMARRIGFGAAQTQVSVPADHSVSVAFALPQTTSSLSEMVVTGASVAPSVEEFTKSPPSIDGARVVSSEVSDVQNARVRHTVYELGSGTQITLAERRVRTGALRIARVGATVVEAQKSTQESHSVSWTASDGTVLTLSGAVPAAELEVLKSYIVVPAATPRP